jgi:predicted Fe-Mo cluster-binding NifX family protein
VARGYCDTHYKQMIRNAEVKPIASRRIGSVRLPGLRISKRAAEALERRGPTVYQAAQATIEEGTRE